MLAQLLIRLFRGDVVELVERLDVHITTEDVAVDPPWEDLADLVVDVLSGGDGKDVIEFFQSALLSFWDEEIDHDQSNDVETTEDNVSTWEMEGGMMV